MPEIDFLLSGSVLVEAVLDGDPHLFERADRSFAEFAGDIVGGQVEEAALVDRDGCFTGDDGFEVEELDVGRHIEREAHLVCSLHMAAQHLAWVAGERGAVEVVDVAEDARLGFLRVAPRDDLECVGVGDREHVGFLHPREAVDRRAVERHAVGEGIVEFGGRDCEALEVAEHVGEPQPHESDTALFHRSQDEFAMLLDTHRLSLSDSVKNGDGAEAGRLHPVSHVAVQDFN